MWEIAIIGKKQFEWQQIPYEKMWEPKESNMAIFYVLKELPSYNSISSKKRTKSKNHIHS